MTHERAYVQGNPVVGADGTGQQPPPGVDPGLMLGVHVIEGVDLSCI